MSLLPPSSGDHPGEPVHGAYSPDPDGPTPFQTSPPWWSRTWVKVAAAAAFIVFTSWRAGVFDTRSDVDRGLDAVQTEFIEMGISEDSWDCIERGLREGGYLEGLEDGVDEADSDALQE